MGQDIKEVCAEYLFMQQCLCQCVPEWLWITPTTYGRDFAYCLKSHGGVRGIYASLWRFLLRCALFCRSDATFLTSVSSYEGGCGFEVKIKSNKLTLINIIMKKVFFALILGLMSSVPTWARETTFDFTWSNLQWAPVAGDSKSFKTSQNGFTAIDRKSVV